MDVLCVREAARFAAEHCRSGKVSKKRREEPVKSYQPVLASRAPSSWSCRRTVTMDTA